MKSPFPGMDPFIEATLGLWGDFHDKLIADIERDLSARVPDHYIVMELQSLIDTIYQRARYGADLDYSFRAGVSLSSEEVAHLDAALAAGKSRSDQP